MSNRVNKKNSVATHYIIKKSDLPLSCPTKDKDGWSLHPRVYLPIEEKGEVTCPYCGDRFVLDTEK